MGGGAATDTVSSKRPVADVATMLLGPQPLRLTHIQITIEFADFFQFIG